ncbi:NBAS subunit of NRZ tethering complex-like isoform X2 [Dreissena polymorpha]|uniref:NBAS subunit of NRZ tethering complex-like isoform X2 n=1 Tax=Dreissena polymorpha TaxID=45954 RepID=UPI00226453C7|nr:NBAS subunit of NRZ tethering complex-like isoform X2 [Dreissena polymorpha]
MRLDDCCLDDHTLFHGAIQNNCASTPSFTKKRLVDHAGYAYTLITDGTSIPANNKNHAREKPSAGKQGTYSPDTAPSRQRNGWRLLRSFGRPFQSGGTNNLPSNFVKLINCTINWRIAVTRDGHLVAVMQDQSVEIRSSHDDFESVTGRVKLEPDSQLQWRQLAWSVDGTMLACSYSNGTVQAYDIVGTQLFAIAGNEVYTGDLSYAVASLVFTHRAKDTEWPIQLLVVNYQGRLSSYKVHRDKGQQLLHEFNFSSHYPLGISCMEWDTTAGLLYAGGCGQDAEGVTTATREGLTAWRVLSDYPHYKLVTDYAQDLKKAKSEMSFSRRLKLPLLSRLRAANSDGVLCMTMSPDMKHLASLHWSGKLCVWSLPGLQMVSSWSHDDQPNANDLSPEHTENPQLRKLIKDLVSTRQLIDVNWWSDRAVILARGTGAVTVCAKETLTNLLSNPEWFEPAPRLTGVHNGGFLGLEVECRFPRKRVLALNADEKDDEDDSDVEEGLLSRSWGVAKQCLHYITDMETFKPPKKKPKLVNRTYRLVCLKKTTPEELFARKLENEEYGEAKLLAQTYGLDVDLVYQRQWKKAPVDRASIQDYLSKISKRSWVLHECMERLSDRLDAMKELLEFGLRGTDLPALIMIGSGEDKGRFILCDPEEGLYEDVELDVFDPEVEKKREQLRQERITSLLKQVNFSSLNLEQRELCRARRKLLQYLYRLNTYENILGGVTAAERYEAKFFEKFRSQNMVQTAITYAQNSDWKALEVLFTYHGRELLPHRLSILGSFPETTNPAEYQLLLPEIRSREVVEWAVDTWNPPDWVETDPCDSALALPIEDPGAFLYELHPDTQKYRGNLSGDIVCGWYEERAVEIERLSRQADCALQLIRLAVEKGVQGLERIQNDFVTMETLVYSCNIDDNFTFRQLQEMSNYEKLELMMSKSTDDMYSKNLRKWLVPFLRQCERSKPGTYIELLKHYVLKMATGDLRRPLQIFESSKTHLPSPVIPKQSDLMSIAIEAIYCCQRDDQLSLAEDILKCLPKRGYGADTKDIERLHIEVDKLENHLFAAKILGQYGVKKPVFYVRDSEKNGDEGEQLMIKLTRLVGRREKEVSYNEWAQLHSDVMELQSKVYRCVTQALCHEIFVEGLLCSNNAGYIRLAEALIERSEVESHRPTPLTYTMQTRIPYHTAIKLVLSAAQEYFNSSANLSDSCINLARACLNLIQDTPPGIQEELDLIAALAVLDDFGLTVLPLQVRLSKDRLALVEQIVITNTSAYQHKQKLLRLGHLLRVGGADKDSTEGRVLHLVAKAAIQQHNFEVAHEVCRELIDAGYGPSWDVCVDLAEHSNLQNLHTRLELLSFGLTYCTADMIEPILQAKALLETQVLCEGIGSEVAEPNPETASRVSPFSAKAALQQTRHILSSTKQTTRAVLSTVTDSKWWQGTVSKLKQPMGRQVSNDLTNQNKDLKLQSCHQFYEGFIDRAYSNNEDADFRHLEEYIEDDVRHIGESLLRTAQLEEMLTEGEKSHSPDEVLVQLAKDCLCTDSTLALAYLLALRQPTDADGCFATHVVTDISLQMALYYYVLQLYTALKPVDLPHMSPLYVKDPVTVMQSVTSLVCGQKDFDWPDYVVALVTKIKHYNEMLEDYRQAEILRNLGKGINIGRFVEDSEYKVETILGLAMSLEEDLYQIAVSLAGRNSVPLWQVYAAQLETIFCDSSLSLEELQERVTKLQLIESLSLQPAAFSEHMGLRVYPELDGTDHARMLYYFSTLLKCEGPLQGGITADGHVKLLKKLKPVAAGLDYKLLLASADNVIDVLSPCITMSNVNTFAKLAKQIPDGRGGMLDASVVYCTWAVKFFWEGDGKRQPDTTTAWIHRYEACGEFLHKLQADHIPTFLQAILYSKKPTQLLEVDCRQEIGRRILKYCRQQTSKKKMPDNEKTSWESAVSVVNGYLEHLTTLSDPVIMAMRSSDNSRVQEYYNVYNLSMGNTDQVKQLLLRVILEGEMSLDQVHSLVSVGPGRHGNIRVLVQEAVEHVLLSLSKKDSSFKPLNIVDPLKSLENIVTNVEKHGEGLVTGEQLMSQLRPFCSDPTVNVQPRLDVLHILEKSFSLSEDDLVLLTLYRTQAVITEVWPDIQVAEAEISTPVSRGRLFSTLLEKSSHSELGKQEFLALAKLLKLWPTFGYKEVGTEQPWVSLLKAMVSHRSGEVHTLVLEVFKSSGMQLTAQETEALFKGLVRHASYLTAVKLGLLSGHDNLYTAAVQTLADTPTLHTDDELLEQLLKLQLVSKLISTPHYPAIVQYLLANQHPETKSHEESCDHLSIQRLAGQLKEAGFEAEAGSLMFQVKSTPQVLQTFGSALGAISKWFK